MTLPVTLITAGAAALINLWLAYRVTRIRFAQGVLVGDGGDSRLAQRMRAQANFTEYVPIVLILIGAIEWTAGTSWPLALAGAAFIVARVLHPFGMDGWLPGRKAGILLTWIVMLLLALTALALPLVQRSGVATDGPAAPTDYRG
jgi:uncharacterized protein